MIFDAATAAEAGAGQAMVSLRMSRDAVSPVPLRDLRIGHCVSAVPYRRFRARVGQKHMPGSYWAATTSGHVTYESLLELSRLLLADFDPEVTDIRSQPFRITAPVLGRTRSHVPDFLLLHRDCRVSVVNVKPADRLAHPRVATGLAWPGELLRAHGWGYEVWSGADAVLLANVRFLAGYRRPMVVPLEAARDAAAQVCHEDTITAAERRLATADGRLAVRPKVLAALWHGMLTTDLLQPLSGDSPLWRAAR